MAYKDSLLNNVNSTSTYIIRLSIFFLYNFQAIPIDYSDQLVNAVKSGDHDKVEDLLSLTDAYVDIKTEDNE